MRANPNPTHESRTWFEFVAATDLATAEILIYDYIGSYGVSASQFDAELKAMGPQSELTMRINSPGGDTMQAAAIYNMLERFKAKNSTTITVIVDGIAASAASWIAMLGDDVVMPENSLMMIHDPAGIVVGGSQQMRTIASVLDKIKQGMAAAYMKKSGQDLAAVESIMSEETWYNAADAVDAGFADRVDNPIDVTAQFDLSRFKHPPDSPVVTSARHGVPTLEDHMVTKNETPAEMEARLRQELTASIGADLKKTAATDAAAAAAAAAAKPETPAEMEARIRGELTAKNADIVALCELAGKPELANGFIAESKTSVEVRAALLAAKTVTKTQARQGSAVNTHQQGADQQVEEDHSDLVATKLDGNKIWANYRKNKGTPFTAAQ